MSNVERTIGFSYTATLRSPFSLKQIKMDKHLNSIQNKNDDIECVFSVIEADSDPYGRAHEHMESYRTTTTAKRNHSHLLIRSNSPKNELLPKSYLRKAPYTIPYYEEIRDLHRITNYFVKHQKKDNYNILLQTSQNQQDFPY